MSTGAWGLRACLGEGSESRFLMSLMIVGFGLSTLFTFGIFERTIFKRKRGDRFLMAIGTLPIGVLMFAAWLNLQARCGNTP